MFALGENCRENYFTQSHMNFNTTYVRRRYPLKLTTKNLLRSHWMCNGRPDFTFTFTYLLTVRVVGAPQMTVQPVFSSFFMFSTALWDLANSRPDVVFPPLFPFATPDWQLTMFSIHLQRVLCRSLVELLGRQTDRQKSYRKRHESRKISGVEDL